MRTKRRFLDEREVFGRMKPHVAVLKSEITQSVKT
jgi:hypothetical protein